jgi:ArsR family transcriptional regulator
LARGDLTVSDITEILGQSQPRVSRHLKLLMEAGLIGRYQEGSWAFFRLSDADAARDFVLGLVSGIRSADPQVERDLERLASVKRKRQDRAAEYFSQNAASWDQIRLLHAPDRAVEAALLKLVGKRPFQAMLDLGTGTGRLLEIFSPLYRRGVGIDMSREMLAVARANLDKAGISNAQVRQGDIFSPPVERDAYDLVTIHQVLHYLDDPARAVREAAKLLRPAGRLVIVDFAPHALEFLRDEHAHLRLGFSDRQIEDWFSESGLDLEDSQEFEPRGGTEARLTVKLWLGRDRRMLVADPSHETQSTGARPVGEIA